MNTFRLFSLHISLRCAVRSLRCAVLSCLIVCLYSVVCSPLYGQAYKPFDPAYTQSVIGSPTRTVLSLAGTWQRINAEGAVVESVNLPYSESEAGIHRYRKTMTLTREQVERNTWYMSFYGANRAIEMKLNDQHVDNHLGGDIPFSIQIPAQFLRPGANTIDIISNSQLDAVSTLPLRRSRLAPKYYGGIVRESFMVGVPNVHIMRADIKHQFVSNGVQVQIATTISASSLAQISSQYGDSVQGQQGQKSVIIRKMPVEISAEIRNLPDSSVVQTYSLSSAEVEANRTQVFNLAMTVANPKVWSLADPHQYAVTVYVKRNGKVIDQYTQTTGFRTVEFITRDGKRILLLNGIETPVYAVGYVEEFPGMGRTLSAEQFDKDIQAFKALGVNVLHYQQGLPHPYLVQLCDKLGIMILAELPVVQVPNSIFKQNFSASALNMIREVSAGFERHPSIIGYSVGEGIDEQSSSYQDYVRQASGIIHQTGSKLVYKVVYGGSTAVYANGCDFVMFSLDRLQPEAFRNELQRLTGLAGKVPFMVMLLHPIHQDNRQGYSDPLSAESQAKYIKDMYSLLSAVPFQAPCIVAPIFDYMTARALLTTNNDNQYMAMVGLSTFQREPRLSSQMVKALFSADKEPIIAAGDYQASTSTLYTFVGLLLLVAFASSFNTSRRFRESATRALLRPFNFYSDVRDQRILSNLYSIGLLAILSMTLSIVISGLLYSVRQSPKLDYLLIYSIPNDGLKSFIDRVVWTPWLSLLIGTLLFAVKILWIAALIRGGAFFVRARIVFSDAFVIAAWGALPALFLLPLAMAAPRLMDTGSYVVFALWCCMGITVWIGYRILRGTAVIYDVRPLFVYVGGLGLITVVVGAIGVWYDMNWALFAYLDYFFSLAI
jgi:hypothetical protein